jgi:hypothetical protein
VVEEAPGVFDTFVDLNVVLEFQIAQKSLPPKNSHHQVHFQVFKKNCKYQ